MSTNEKFWIGFGDIHEDLSLVDEIPNLADADGVIISGDITNRGGIRRASELLEVVFRINPNIYAQIGNMDRPEITSYLENQGYEQVKHLPNLILVAHDPPFGSKAADLPFGENVGNRSVLEFIQRVQPDICLTGHIHEAESEDFIGKTKVLNPGMLCMGGYVLIRLEGDELEANLMYI